MKYLLDLYEVDDNLYIMNSLMLKNNYFNSKYKIEPISTDNFL